MEHGTGAALRDDRGAEPLRARLLVGFPAGVQGLLFLQLLGGGRDPVRVAAQTTRNGVVGQGGAGVVPVGAVDADALELVHLYGTNAHAQNACYARHRIANPRRTWDNDKKNVFDTKHNDVAIESAIEIHASII